MKVLKVIFIVFAILVLVAAMALFVLLKTFDANKYKAKIVEEISKSINRGVGLEHISLALSTEKGLIAVLRGLSISDDPDFSQDHFVEIDTIRLGLDIHTFFTQRKIIVTEIEFIEPRIQIIRNQAGDLNVLQFTHADQSPPPPQNFATTQEKQTKYTIAPSEDVLDNLLIRSIELNGGRCFYSDQTEGKEITIALEKINMETDNVSFTKPFHFQLSSALFSENANIFMNGTVQLTQQGKNVRLSDTHAKILLNEISLEKLIEAVPLIKDVKLQESLQGQVDIDVDELVVKGAEWKLSLRGKLNKGRVRLQPLAFPIENINADFFMTEKDFTLKELYMYIANGRATVKGGMKDYLNTMDTKFSVSLDRLSINEVLPENVPVKMAGEVVGELYGTLEAKDLKKIVSTSKYDGQVNIENGKILDLNILRFVLDKISIIPNLGQKLINSLPDQYKEKLKQKDTPLDKVKVNLNVAGGHAVSKGEVDADGFLLFFHSDLDYTERLQFTGELFVPKELSAAMINSVSELSSLADEENRIYIPLRRYDGKLKDFLPFPDLEYLGKTIIKSKGKDELKKVIFKALDLKEQTTPDQPSTDQKPSSKEEKQEARPEEILIDNILDAILK